MLEREKERDGTHTFRKVAMCKWQMDDPEARVKSSLSDCTWLQDLSMDLSSRHLRTYEEKNRGAPMYIYIYITFILFPSHFSFSFFFSFFFLFFLLYFSSHHIFFIFFIFFFCSSKLLQHNTYIAFVRDDVMTPPPCLNDPRPRA
jgi:hypothetical protein